MSITSDLIRNGLRSKDGETISDVLNIQFPEYGNNSVVVIEYDGIEPRMYSESDHDFVLLLPKNINDDMVMENAVVDAIESGDIFEDRDAINDNVKYITMTHIPVSGLAHKNLDEPTALPNIVKAVVGVMGPDHHFGRSSTDIENGMNYVRDVTSHGTDSDEAIGDLTAHYMHVGDKEHGMPHNIRKHFNKMHDEVEDIKDLKPEDSLDKDDYDEIGLDTELDDDEPEYESEPDIDDDEDSDDNYKDEEKDKDNDEDEKDEEEDEDEEDVDYKDESAEINQPDAPAPAGAVDYYKKPDVVDTVMSNPSKSATPPNTSSFGKPNPSNAIKEANQKMAMNKNKSSFKNVSNTTTNSALNTSTPNTIKTDIKVKEYAYEYTEEELFEETSAMLIKPKRLKPIPRDVIAYIVTQKNAIRDTNDQAMISGYTCAKLELIDFYLNCLDTHDYRYIVPHNRQYLVQMQNDLNRLLQEILRVKPVNRLDRVWKINVTYPEGYGG